MVLPTVCAGLSGGPDFPIKISRLRLAYASFGKLDSDTEIDFGKHCIEPIVARTVLKVAGHRFQAQQGALIEAARQQSDLELIKRIQRSPPLFHHAASPLRRLLDSLKRDQGINPAQRAQ